MKKKDVQKEIDLQLSAFIEAKDANKLAKSINNITEILQGLKIDEGQKEGINLLIGLVQKTLKDAAIEKVKGKYNPNNNFDVRLAVSYVIPEILDMAIFE